MDLKCAVAMFELSASAAYTYIWMDIIGALVTSVLLPVFWDIIQMIFRQYTFDDIATVDKIDHKLTNGDWQNIKTSVAYSMQRLTPGDGRHFVWRGGPAILSRSTTHPDRGTPTTTYCVYSAKMTAERIFKDIVTKKPDSVRINVYAKPKSDWSMTWAICAYLARPPTTEQKSLTSRVAAEYARSGETRGIGVLITGAKGTGKSTFVQYLALSLEKNGLSPTLITGMSLKSRGLCVPQILQFASEGNPGIILLDEIDEAFARAYDAKVPPSMTDATAIADSREALHSALDVFAMCPRLIIVATTNCTFTELDDRYPAAVRNGRFDSKLRATFYETISVAASP